jgi:hypothetical protein
MKTNLETLKKEALQTLELSPRTKESAVNADLQKLTSTIKTLSKRKDLVVMVFEK